MVNLDTCVMTRVDSRSDEKFTFTYIELDCVERDCQFFHSEQQLLGTILKILCDGYISAKAYMSIDRQRTRQVLSQAGASSQATSARRMRRNRKAVLWPRHPLILVSRNYFITHTTRNKNGWATKLPRKIVRVLDKPKRKDHAEEKSCRRRTG